MRKEYLYITIAAIFWGTITVGGKFFADLGLSLYEISVYRALSVSLITLCIILYKRKYFIKKSMVPFFLIYGLLGALLDLTSFAGIVLGVSVAIVSLLIYSQPIWTTIFSRFMLGEKITKSKIIAIIVALAGVLFLLRIWDVGTIGSLAGVICAVLGGIFLSLWVVWAKKSGIDNQHYITAMIGWSFFQFLWLLILWPLVSFFIHDQTISRLSFNVLGQYWYLFLLFASISGILPYLFLQAASRKCRRLSLVSYYS